MSRSATPAEASRQQGTRRRRALAARGLGALLVAGASLLESGCARGFTATGDPPVRSPWVNARADWLATGPRGEVRVRLAATGAPGVHLENALLARSDELPCYSTRTFFEIARDGTRPSAGPLTLEGAHVLSLGFLDEPTLPRLTPGAAVDLVLVRDGGRGCVRVPLVGMPQAPAWKPVDAARFAMGAEVRSVPVRLRDPARAAPVGGAGFWFGLEKAEYRAQLRGSAAFTTNPTSRASGHLTVTAAGTRALVRRGPVALTLTLGYGLDGYFVRDAGAERATRHLLHGPELTPAVTLALVPDARLPAAAGGALHLELGTPALLWFGVPGADGVTALAGVAVGAYGVF